MSVHYLIKNRRTNEILRQFNHADGEKAIKFFLDWAIYNEMHTYDLVLMHEIKPTKEQVSSYTSMKRVKEKHKKFVE
jgi:hypothetical protein